MYNKYLAANITAELIAGNLIARNEITRKSKFVII